MFRKLMLTLIFIAAFGCLTATLSAQSIDDKVSVYKSANGMLYLQPLADTFGANLNSGWFRTARIPKSGFHLYIGAKGVVSPISSSQKTFTSVSEEDLPAGLTLPTIFGSEDGVFVDELNTDVFGVWDTDWVPMAVPQLTVGSVLGTEFTFRWFDMRVDDEIGDLTLTGYGLRHSISQYIPNSPIELALGYYMQTFKVGDIVEARSSYVGLHASYHVSVIGFYGGFGVEKSNLDIEYTYTSGDDRTRIEFELEGSNSTRFTVGVLFDFPVIKIHADYSIAAQNVITAGVGLGF